MSDFKAKWTKFDVRWGSSAPYSPAGGAYSAFSDLLAVFVGLLLRGWGGEGKEWDRDGKLEKEKRKGGKGRGREKGNGSRVSPPLQSYRGHCS